MQINFSYTLRNGLRSGDENRGRKSSDALTFDGRVAAAGAGAVGGVAHGAMSVEGERFCDLTVSPGKNGGEITKSVNNGGSLTLLDQVVLLFFRVLFVHQATSLLPS